jgi:hypothetical protein
MTRVFLNVVPTSLSRAMHRVAAALREAVPSGVQIVEDVDRADIQVIHTIGMEGMPAAIARAKEYALIQYCWSSANGSAKQWAEVWAGARLVWSYYRLPLAERFLHMPLGVDGTAFTLGNGLRPIGAMTSGYVAGPGAEAIAEVAEAALLCGLSVVHIGPQKVAGMILRKEKSWSAKSGLSDAQLADAYRHAQWVSGLRHIEGFELPVLEGLACGARPIVFDRADMRQWYDGLAEFVPECSGPSLVRELQGLFERGPRAVTETERAQVLDRFSWNAIAGRFWKELLCAH